MNKSWINTRVIFEWDGTQYVEKTVEGYWYEGQLSLADVNHYAGHGAGGGGGAGGNGGMVILITSNLSQPLIDDSILVVDVSKGQKGTKGFCGGSSGNGTNSNHGSDANNAANGINMTVVV